MNSHYLAGLALGILGGFFTQGGQLLEKWAVNRVRTEHPRQGFIGSLFKNPVWVVGFFIGLGLGTAAYMAAQSLIGPALTPGLMASGLILLALGSVRMNHEELNRTEILGIVLMVIGIAFLGLSGLGINATQVRKTLTDPNALLRILIFTLCFLACFVTIRTLVIRKGTNRKGMLIALGNGFLACLSDFWINPLLALIVLVVGLRGSTFQNMICGLAAGILVFCASLITWQNQVAFKYAQASNIVPVAQVPIQVAPVIVYFFIFGLTPPGPLSVFYILAGTVLTILAGFLLGRRPEVPILD